MSGAIRLLCILTPAVLWGQTSSGTAGVVLWTPGRVVIAIDSRMTLTEAGGLSRQGPDTCKLRGAGRFLLAIAGLHDHAETNFDAWRLGTESLVAAGSVTEAATLLEQRVAPEVRMALLNLQSGGRVFRDAHVVAVIAGVDDGWPVVAARDFVPDSNGGVRILRWEGAPDKAAAYAFGEHGAIDGAGVRELIAKLGMAKAARRLVELEIENSPRTVGPPVSVAEITKDGVNWLERGLCR